MRAKESREEEDAWMEESLISSGEDAALWCKIVWSCHLSQASLKAKLKPVMGLTSLSSHSFMSLFIFCFVTPPLLHLLLSLWLSSLFLTPVSLMPSDSALTFPPVSSLLPGDIVHFTRNILIILCSSASSLCRTTCECPETRARYAVV